VVFKDLRLQQSFKLFIIIYILAIIFPIYIKKILKFKIKNKGLNLYLNSKIILEDVFHI